jgi:hypothetical protein
MKRAFPNDVQRLVTMMGEFYAEDGYLLNHQRATEAFATLLADDRLGCVWFIQTDGQDVALSQKLRGYKVGIVGLGGTGSYVLDLVGKTSADEIHLFDGDVFAQHNAFRAPGAPTVEQLREPPLKVKYFAEIYSKMRRRIHPHAVFLNASNVALLSGLSFVFLCLDKGRPKQEIVAYLEATGASFVDVGMGIHVGDENLLGILRVTTSTPKDRSQIRKHVPFDDGEDDEYATNIQIADLNMLNAALAVIRWKKLAGFYHDAEGEHHSTYTINVNQLLSAKALP